jgi:hypothetical protein
MKYKKQLSEDLVTGLNIKTKVVGQSILGDDNFVSWAQETFLEKRKDRERPNVGKIHSYLSKNRKQGMNYIGFNRNCQE